MTYNQWQGQPRCFQLNQRKQAGPKWPRRCDVTLKEDPWDPSVIGNHLDQKMGGALLVGLLHLVTGSVGGRLAGLTITDQQSKLKKLDLRNLIYNSLLIRWILHQIKSETAHHYILANNGFKEIINGIEGFKIWQKRQGISTVRYSSLYGYIWKLGNLDQLFFS